MQIRVPVNIHPDFPAHHFVEALDMFHPEAFIGTPAEGVIKNPLPRRAKWYAVDWCGNLIGELGLCPCGDRGDAVDVDGVSLRISAVTVDHVNGRWVWVLDLQ